MACCVSKQRHMAAIVAGWRKHQRRAMALMASYGMASMTGSVAASSNGVVAESKESEKKKNGVAIT